MNRKFSGGGEKRDWKFLEINGTVNLFVRVKINGKGMFGEFV